MAQDSATLCFAGRVHGTYIFEDESKRRQRNAFDGKNKLYEESIPLKTVVGGIEQFVLPLVRGVARNGSWTRAWNRGGPWH